MTWHPPVQHIEASSSTPSPPSPASLPLLGWCTAAEVTAADPLQSAKHSPTWTPDRFICCSVGLIDGLMWGACFPVSARVAVCFSQLIERPVVRQMVMRAHRSDDSVTFLSLLFFHIQPNIPHTLSFKHGKKGDRFGCGRFYLLTRLSKWTQCCITSLLQL